MNTLYLIEANFGRLGKAFIETDRDQNSRTHAIELIRSGEVDPIKVLEIDEDAGTVRDVTDEIVSAAILLMERPAPLSSSDVIAAQFDRARALRKEMV